MTSGVFLNDATGAYPVTVLGAVAAQRLGITDLRPDTAVWLGDRLFRVAGVIAPLPLAPDIDRSALIGYGEAAADFASDGAPTTIYVRAATDQVTGRAERARADREPRAPRGGAGEPPERRAAGPRGRRQRVHVAAARARRRGAAGRRRETLRAWGIPVHVTYPRTVADGIRLVGELGELLEAGAPARDLEAALRARYEEVRAAAVGRRPRRVFCPIWRKPYMTINADTYIHDMLAVSGGINVFGGAVKRYPEVTLDAARGHRRRGDPPPGRTLPLPPGPPGRLRPVPRPARGAGRADAPRGRQAPVLVRPADRARRCGILPPLLA